MCLTSGISPADPQPHLQLVPTPWVTIPVRRRVQPVGFCRRTWCWLGPFFHQGLVGDGAWGCPAALGEPFEPWLPPSRRGESRSNLHPPVSWRSSRKRGGWHNTVSPLNPNHSCGSRLGCDPQPSQHGPPLSSAALGFGGEYYPRLREPGRASCLQKQITATAAMAPSTSAAHNVLVRPLLPLLYPEPGGWLLRVGACPHQPGGSGDQ